MQHTRLLWTGGWDSTYQLLRLLLDQRRPVAPYYLKRGKRPSTEVEIDTMARIRAALAEQHPHTRDLLAPTQFSDVAGLVQDPAISEAYERTLRATFIGRQYEWLAWFCTEQGIDDIQLCIHRDDKAHAVIEPYVIRVAEADGESTYRFDPNFADTDQYALFGRFSFPLFETSKLDMARVAGEYGWNDIMHMTWFCHRPRKDQQPCGRCNPCLYTIEEGLGWRIPASSRMTSAVYRTFVHPFKAPAKALLRRLHA